MSNHNGDIAAGKIHTPHGTVRALLTHTALQYYSTNSKIDIEVMIDSWFRQCISRKVFLKIDPVHATSLTSSVNPLEDEMLY